MAGRAMPPLLRVKAEACTRSWSALYQQRPVPDTGHYYQAEWLHQTDAVPNRSTLQVCSGFVYAVTAGGGDWTVHFVVGMDPEGKLWLLDHWRGNLSGRPVREPLGRKASSSNVSHAAPHSSCVREVYGPPLWPGTASITC